MLWMRSGHVCIISLGEAHTQDPLVGVGSLRLEVEPASAKAIARNLDIHNALHSRRQRQRPTRSPHQNNLGPAEGLLVPASHQTPTCHGNNCFVVQRRTTAEMLTACSTIPYTAPASGGDDDPLSSVNLNFFPVARLHSMAQHRICDLLTIKDEGFAPPGAKS